MKKRTVKILKWIGIVAIAMAVLYAVLLGLGHRSLSRAYAALEADGRPMKLEQVTPAEIPDPDNAAPIYQAVALLLKAEAATEQDSSAEYDNLLDELNDLASRILEGKPDAKAEEWFIAICQRQVVQEAMTLHRRGAGRKGCWHDLDWSKGPDLQLPHLGDYMRLSRILCTRARVRAANGNVQEAWDDVVTSLRFANALRREPILVNQLVRAAQFNYSVNVTRFVAEIGPPDDHHYKEIAELLTNFEDTAPFVLAIDGERLVLGEWAFNLPPADLLVALEEEGPNNVAVRIVFRVFHPLIRLYNHAAHLTVMHAFAKNAAAPYSPSDAKPGGQLLNDVPPYCILTRTIAPDLSNMKRKYLSMIAQARVTRAGLALLKHARNGNAYPEDLAALRADNLVDPFGGKILRYRTTGSGFVTYSVGENLTDDGGTPPKEKRVVGSVLSGDIAWEYRGEEKTEPSSKADGEQPPLTVSFTY